jgi:cysteine-rich repeat protein
MDQEENKSQRKIIIALVILLFVFLGVLIFLAIRNLGPKAPDDAGVSGGNVICMETCSVNSDCATATTGAQTACVAGRCVNVACPNNTIYGGRCDCSIQTKQCGERCGYWANNINCGPGYTCQYVNGPSCTGDQTAPTYCAPIGTGPAETGSTANPNITTAKCVVNDTNNNYVIAAGQAADFSSLGDAAIADILCGTTGAVCGNGTVETGEQCDDGNTSNGDSCSSTCQTTTSSEPDYYSCTQPIDVLTYSLQTVSYGSAGYYENFVDTYQDDPVRAVQNLTLTHRNRTTLANLTLSELNNYDVLWLFNGCGSTNTLSAAEVTAIREYLVGGGALFLQTDDGFGDPIGGTGGCYDGVNQVLTGLGANASGGLATYYGTACNVNVTINTELGTNGSPHNLLATPAIINITGPATTISGQFVPIVSSPASEAITAYIDGVGESFGTVVLMSHYDIQTTLNSCGNGVIYRNAFEYFQYELCQETAVCGNSTIETGEQCDDGNTTNGDGCSAQCITTTQCNDGVDNSDPEDTRIDCTSGAADPGCFPDGNGGGGSCDPTDNDETDIPPVCGNGVLQTGEQCDDSNTTSGDGCSATCQVTTECNDGVDNDSDGNIDCNIGDQDPGCFPNGQGGGGACNPNDDSEIDAPSTCGNSITEVGETCDDGNTTAGDGCSAVCQITTQCSDGVDNDGDGRIDCTSGAQDLGCYPNGNGGGGACNPADNSEPNVTTQCSDGIDNDLDGFIDCNAGNSDPGCFPNGAGGGGACNPQDNSEANLPVSSIFTDSTRYLLIGFSWIVMGLLIYRFEVLRRSGYFRRNFIESYEEAVEKRLSK